MQGFLSLILEKDTINWNYHKILFFIRKGGDLCYFLWKMFSWILPILAVLVLLIVIAAGYVKAPPDQAYIISGLKKEARILIRPGGYPGPVFETSWTGCIWADDRRY